MSSNVEIRQLGGKFILVEGKPVGVWLVDENNAPKLHALTEVSYADLEKLIENNQNV